MNMPDQPLKTTLVGSYPVPHWLIATPSRTGVLDATKVVMKTQEDAGIDVVVDGELYRWDVNHPETNGMIDYFIGAMSGIRTEITRTDVREFQLREDLEYRSEPAGVVEEQPGEGTLDIPTDYRRARSCTNHHLKFTVTGPHMLSKTLMNNQYGDRAELAIALAEVLSDQIADIDPEVLQLDEANVTGHPEEGEWAAEALNIVLDAADGADRKGVHLCFGNYGGQSIQEGHWQDLFDLMNQLHCDHVVMEFAFRGYDELAYFRDGLKPEMDIGLGVIDVKSNLVETPEQVAKRIEKGVETVGAERIGWIHPDCGFWMNKRTIADQKIQALVDGRDLFLGNNE